MISLLSIVFIQWKIITLFRVFRVQQIFTHKFWPVLNHSFAIQIAQFHPTVPAHYGGNREGTEAFLAAILSVSTFILLFPKNKTKEDIWLRLPRTLSSTVSPDFYPLSLTSLLHTIPITHSFSSSSLSSAPLCFATSVNLISLIQDQCFPLSHPWVLWMYYIKSLRGHCATYVKQTFLGAQQKNKHQLAASHPNLFKTTENITVS